MKRKWPERGSVRVREKFLFFPLTIRKEMRWLMKARWLEVVNYYGPFHSDEITSYRWDPIYWIDEPFHTFCHRCNLSTLHIKLERQRLSNIVSFDTICLNCGYKHDLTEYLGVDDD